MSTLPEAEAMTGAGGPGLGSDLDEGLAQDDPDSVRGPTEFDLAPGKAKAPAADDRYELARLSEEFLEGAKAHPPLARVS